MAPRIRGNVFLKSPVLNSSWKVRYDSGLAVTGRPVTKMSVSYAILRYASLTALDARAGREDCTRGHRIASVHNYCCQK